jgi:hypothetical protein
MAQTKDRPIEKAAPARSAIPGMSAADAAAAYAAQMKRNVEARDRMVEEFGIRTPQELAEAGVPADRAIFSVRYREAEGFPGFQFDEKGRPLAVIADILAILRDVRSPWEIALWFTGANLWLSEDRPVDCLRTAPERVVEAARHEAEELVF